jgi:enediyne biosynthesis protein E4
MRWLAALFPLACLAIALRGSGPSSPEAITFEDTAASAGINFVLRNAATPERHQIETMAGGVAIFDYNNDGRPDLYFVNGAPQPSLEKADPSWFNRLYRNNGDGTFTDVTTAAGVAGSGFDDGVAVADYDNDGWEDLFVAGVNRNILYRNRGDGTFADVTSRAALNPPPGAAKPWSVSAGWFDYDNDGRLDLFVVNYCKWVPEREPPCTIGKARTYCHPKYYEGLPNSLYHNNGDGTFTDVSISAGIAAHIGKGMGLSFLDFDRDGRIDVFVANDTTPNFLFRNLGNGRFRETATTAGVAFSDDGQAISSMGADARDFNNDGIEDLFITANESETFPLFRGLDRGIFADLTYASRTGAQTVRFTGWGAGIFDFNNDGLKDLFAAGGAIDDNVEEFAHRRSRQTNLLLANAGGNGFRNVSDTAGRDFQYAALHRGAAFGDLNGDGLVDIAVSRIGERPAIFRNTSHHGNHYLAVRLRGRRSNRDGIGALIHVRGASGRDQWNRVTTAVGYASSSERVAFFGMADDTTASVEVFWPSGVRQQARQTQCDRYLTLEEP